MARLRGKCVIASGAPNSNGYARCTVDGKRQYAHRVSYKAVHGRIPEGLQVDHLCRNRMCVNPDHLEAVTGKVNSQRGLAGHHMKTLTACRKGHPYDEKTYIVPSTGQRVCRKCKAEWWKQYVRPKKTISAS